MAPERGLAGSWTAAELGVHPVIGGGPMTAYIRRPHDTLLRTMLDPDVTDSRLVVVRGDPATGKTRAVYEVIADRLADWSLEELRAAGASEAVAALLARDPAGKVTVGSDPPFRLTWRRHVARLLAALRAAGADDAVRVLAGRGADAGLFGLFLETYPGEAPDYRFGREPDGSPSLPWTWQPPGGSA